MPEPGDIPADELEAMADDDGDADDASDGADSDDGPRMDCDCHNCGTALSPGYTWSAPGRMERSGVCPDCRVLGIGSATIIRQDPDAMSDRVQDRLETRQGRKNAQSTTTAAAFIDDRMPRGDYEVRRTQPKELTITCDDGVPSTDVRRLAQRLTAFGPWDVNAIDTDDGVIVLLDATFADAS